MHFIVNTVYLRQLHLAISFFLTCHTDQMDQTDNCTNQRNHKNCKQDRQTLFCISKVLPHIIKGISLHQRVTDCTIKFVIAFFQNCIGVCIKIIRIFSQMVTAEACGKHQCTLCLANFASCGIAADNVALFIFYVIQEVFLFLQITDTAFIFIQLPLDIHLIIRWQTCFYQFLIFRQICLQAFRDLPINDQAVIGFIDLRIACDNAIHDAIISFEAADQFLSIHCFPCFNAVFILIINIRQNHMIQRFMEEILKFSRIIDRICIDDISAPFFGDIHRNHTAEKYGNSTNEKQNRSQCLPFHLKCFRFFRFCSQCPTPPSDIWVLLD